MSAPRISSASVCKVTRFCATFSASHARKGILPIDPLAAFLQAAPWVHRQEIERKRLRWIVDRPARYEIKPIGPGITGVPSGILVVDDVPDNRTLLERLLTAQGCRVETACDGLSALQSLDHFSPDLILLDVQMPGLDGFEVCRRIKDHPATRLTPVVLITGLSDRASRIRGIEAGADDFIHKPFDVGELTARVSSLLRLKRYTDDLESAESVILSLGLTVEARDAYTNGHCERLANYATMLGGTLGLTDIEAQALRRGGYLHDLGKIGIPDSILLKPTALTPAEYEVMKQHTVIGDMLCGNLRSLALVRPIVRHHHERLDGSGYPDGLRAEAIPLLAQIISVVDTYDAITTDRPYRKARSTDEAIAELRAGVARGIVSGDLVEAFVSVLRPGIPYPAAHPEHWAAPLTCKASA
jgi:putative two-component system response regulator